MQFVIIKYRAQTVDNDHMPLFLYTEPLRVVKETEDTIIIQHNEFYTYEFNKKYIERYL